MLSSHNKIHGLNPQDTVLFHSSMSFDLSVSKIWCALTSGATMALAAQETRHDPTKLARFMREAGVTVTYFPATQFALLLEHNAEDLGRCSKYREAIFAGEYLPVRLVKAIYDLKTPVTVYNQWGPTETTVQTSFHKTSYPSSLDLNLPVGFPIPNCSHYVVDRHLKPVPASVIGELCIGGAQTGHGYLNLRDITDETFIEDPFASDEFRDQGWNKMYRTGDRGRFLSDGQIDFKGRISGDKQIKLRGLRIDLAEIENEIHLASKRLESTRVADVAVLPRILTSENSALTDDRQLVAFVVPSKKCTKAEQKKMVDVLHKILGISLNDYMLPSGYQFMESLSTLVSSKLDRQLLLKSELDLVFPSTVLDVENEETSTAQREHEVLISVTEAFRKVLKLPDTLKVEPTERFFDLGGSSILLLRLRAVLKRKFNFDVSLEDLFYEPTPLGIAQKVIGHLDPVPASARSIEWAVEAALPNDSRYYPRLEASLLPRSDITDILLTGVESFHGIHMLATLLNMCPSVTIHVIGSQNRVELQELSEAFDQWNLFKPSITRETLTSRTRCVPGTLAEAHFGLNNQDFQMLGRNAQSIYHLGGHTSLLKTYTDLKRANVGSTLDVIELACQGQRLTEIHYLSTWSVPHLQAWSVTKRTHNTIDLSEVAPSHYQPSCSDKFGYFKSRWVAEMLLSEAATRNIPVTIYRASAITAGTTAAGAKVTTPNDNFTHNMILDTIELGIVPDFHLLDPPFAIDFIPIDYLTSTLALLSSGTINTSSSDFPVMKDAKNQPKYYHISNPAPLKLRDLPALMAKIRSDGTRGSTVPVAEWTRKMRERASDCSSIDKARRQMEWKVFEQYLDLGHTMFSLDTKATTEALGKLDGGAINSSVFLSCPPVDEMYLGNLFRSRVASQD
jgi:thioester reductase-like protein